MTRLCRLEVGLASCHCSSAVLWHSIACCADWCAVCIHRGGMARTLCGQCASCTTCSRPQPSSSSRSRRSRPPLVSCPRSSRSPLSISSRQQHCPRRRQQHRAISVEFVGGFPGPGCPGEGVGVMAHCLSGSRRPVASRRAGSLFQFAWFNWSLNGFARRLMFEHAKLWCMHGIGNFSCFQSDCCPVWMMRLVV